MDVKSLEPKGVLTTLSREQDLSGEHFCQNTPGTPNINCKQQ